MKAWEKVCHKLLNGMIDYDVYTWPPTCTGLFINLSGRKIRMMSQKVLPSIRTQQNKKRKSTSSSRALFSP